MHYIDVQLLGHFFTNQVLSRNFVDQPAWHSFCLNVLLMKTHDIPLVDFSQKKVLVVPTLETDPAYFEQCSKSRYQFYTGCSLQPRTQELEVHFYACEQDALSQVVLQNALIILSIPKDEPYTIIKDKFDNRMATLQPSLNSLYQQYTVASKRQESFEVNSKDQYEAFLHVASRVRKTYLGRCLNT